MIILSGLSGTFPACVPWTQPGTHGHFSREPRLNEAAGYADQPAGPGQHSLVLHQLQFAGRLHHVVRVTGDAHLPPRLQHLPVCTDQERAAFHPHVLPPVH
jgi:hypothetical protein